MSANERLLVRTARFTIKAPDVRSIHELKETQVATIKVARTDHSRSREGKSKKEKAPRRRRSSHRPPSSPSPSPQINRCGTNSTRGMAQLAVVVLPPPSSITARRAAKRPAPWTPSTGCGRPQSAAEGSARSEMTPAAS